MATNPDQTAWANPSQDSDEPTTVGDLVDHLLVLAQLPQVIGESNAAACHAAVRVITELSDGRADITRDPIDEYL